MDNTDFSKKLRCAIRQNGISQSDLAIKTGITPSSISDWLNGKYVPKQDKIFLLASALSVRPSYLLGYEDNEANTNDTITEIPMDSIIFDDYFPLHYWSGLSAGSFEELIEAEPDSVVYVPITFQNKKKRLHAFKINGTSMNNVIPDGSIVVSEDNYNNAIKYTDGTIVVAFMDGTATVKRLYSSEDSITLSPDSTDKSHMPIIVSKDKELVIIGKVIWHMNPEDIAEKCY